MKRYLTYLLKLVLLADQHEVLEELGEAEVVCGRLQHSLELLCVLARFALPRLSGSRLRFHLAVNVAPANGSARRAAPIQPQLIIWLLLLLARPIGGLGQLYSRHSLVRRRQVVYLKPDVDLDRCSLLILTFIC